MTWRALKPTNSMTPCGCETDDDSLSPEHLEGGPAQSAGDRDRVHHYPVGKEPKTWCAFHRADRPCDCDRPQPKKTVVKPQPKSKGKTR